MTRTNRTPVSRTHPHRRRNLRRRCHLTEEFWIWRNPKAKQTAAKPVANVAEYYSYPLRNLEKLLVLTSGPNGCLTIPECGIVSGAFVFSHWTSQNEGKACRWHTFSTKKSTKKMFHLNFIVDQSSVRNSVLVLFLYPPHISQVFDHFLSNSFEIRFNAGDKWYRWL